MRKLLALLAIALSCPLAQAQNIEGQIIASQYQFKVQGYSPNTYSWPGGTCNASGPQKQFAFAAGAPVTIVDGTPAMTETVTPTIVLNNNQTCAISIAPANNHQVPFFIQSGTGGLQEALNQNLTDPLTNTVILDNAWYQSVGAANAQAVIAAAKGGTQLGLVDVTTVPTSFYAWSGSQYIQVSAGGGATAPATTLVYKGSGGINGIIPATPGVDYVIPSGSILGTAAGTVPATGLVLKGSGTPGVAVPGIPGDDYVIPTGNVATATSLQTAGTPCSGSLLAGGVDARGNSINCASGGSGGGGGPGAALQLGAYLVAGNTVSGAPGIYALQPSTTLAQANTFFSTAPANTTAFIPEGTAQLGWTNTAVQTKDLRKFADYLQITRYGAVCDEQPLSVSLTAGSNLVNVGSLSGAAQDIGKTMTFATQTGFAYNAAQYSWTPTIVSYSNPNFTLSANAPFNFSGVAQLGTLNTSAIQTALNDANQVFPLSIPSGCRMLTDTLHWNRSQSIVGRQMNASGFVFMPGHHGLIQPDAAAITSWSITSNVATFQTPAGNGFAAGDPVTLLNFATSTFFNGQILNVLASGLSGTQFQLTVGHANGSATETGKAVSTFGANGAGTRLENLGLVLDAGVDPSQVTGGTWTSYDAAATPTVQPAMYEPLFDHSPLAEHPLAPGWLTSGQNGVAKTTQNSSVICVPTALGRVPTVGQQIMFPYFTSIFTATVSSNTGAGCSAGFTGTTLSAALPATAQYTNAQAEWFTGTAIQSTTTTIPTTITYPLTLTLTLSTSPIPKWESNFPSHGHIKVCGIEADYMGGSQLPPYTIVLRRGPSSSAGCSGTTPIAPLNPCPAKNLFGSSSDQPWPVLPSINAGDSTPSGANWFPGECGGAAAIGFPMANGNVNGTQPGLFNAFLENIEFDTTAVQNTNQTMAIYTAGNSHPYGTDIGGSKVSGLWGGIMQGPASSGQHGVGPAASTGAGNTIHNTSIHAAFPFSFVDFQQSSLDRADTYSTEISPFDGTNVGVATCLHYGYTADEQTGALITLTAQDKTTVWNCEPENGSHIERNPYIVSDGFNMLFDGNVLEGINLYFGGSHQTVKNSQISYPAFNYGNNNDFGDLEGAASAYVTNVFNGQQQFYNWGTNSKCDNYAGGSGPSVGCGSSFVQPYSGHSMESSITGSHAYENSLGGMINPAEWNTQSSLDASPMSIGYTLDPTEDFWGAYSACNLGGSAFCQSAHMDGFNGLLYIGPHNRISDEPYIIDAHFKTANAPGSFTLRIFALDSGDGNCASPGQVLAQTVNTTTTWATSKIPVDFTGKAACTILVQYLNGSTTDQVRVGKFNLVPVPGQVLLPTATPTIGASCSGPNAIIGSSSSSLLSCLNGVVVAGSGSSGITALTGDVTATGPGSVAAAVQSFGGGSLNFNGLVQSTAGVASQATQVNVSGSIQAGTSLAAGIDTVAPSATPVFNGVNGNTHNLQLTQNATSSSFTAGPGGSLHFFKVCQDTTGGWTFAWPTNFSGFPSVTLTASGAGQNCTTVLASYDAASGIMWGDQYNAALCINGAASNVPCGKATRGYFAVPAGTNATLAILTSAVGSDSGFSITPTPFASSLLGVTCNTTPVLWGVSAITPGTGFTVETYGTTATNPECFSWSLINR